MAPETMKRPHLPEIDALRGLAALMVAFVFHIHHLLGWQRTGPLDGLPIFSWIHDNGYAMVDLFFVISGFIFSHVYLSQGRMTSTAKDFAVARFARLYPLHLATLIVVAGVSVVGWPSTVENCCNDQYHFLLKFLMLQESGLNRGLSFNGPAGRFRSRCCATSSSFWWRHGCGRPC